jgi:hypothetical protein
MTSSMLVPNCCIPGHRVITQAHIDRLEQTLDAFNAELPKLQEFILPGGGPAASACHLARTIVRRAERRVWALSRVEAVHEDVPKYLNRLSDLLFVIAQYFAEQNAAARYCGVTIEAASQLSAIAEGCRRLMEQPPSTKRPLLDTGKRGRRRYLRAVAGLRRLPAAHPSA